MQDIKRIRNIDWASYPCESCPNYHCADDCVCGRLDEWSKEQEKNIKEEK